MDSSRPITRRLTRSKIYDYFNSVAECKNIRYDGVNAGPGTCNADVWPKDVPKLVKTTWNSYPGEVLPLLSHKDDVQF